MIEDRLLAGLPGSLASGAWTQCKGPAASESLRVCIGGVGGWGLAPCERPQLRPLFMPKL